MKNRYVLIIITSAMLGVFIGMTNREYERKKDIYISKDEGIKKEIYIANKDIKKLNKEKQSIEKELEKLKIKYEDEKNIKKVENLKSSLSYTDITNSGVVINIDALNEEAGNIANIIDYNKILINIINELKINGAKLISINGERLNQYSAIVLAGNHININSVPIAQPYEIKVIGDYDKLYKYINKKNNYLTNIENNYPIKVEFKVDKNITLQKMNVPNKLEYIKGE
jgi:uncharacterized protein YlxW (UPF0749 family)